METEVVVEAERGLKSLSHQQRVSSQPSPSTTSSSPRSGKRHVRFDFSTTDINLSLLRDPAFRYSCSERHCCRPILKYTPAMSGYLRKAGSTFARALSALGAWCTGVTSENPNVRNDHYKQIIAHIRGSSLPLKHAAEAALYQNVHGLWMQLVEDFSIRRDNYATSDQIL